MIEKTNRKATFALILFGGLKGTARAVPVWLGTLFLLSILDHWMGIPSWARQLLWTIGMVGSAASFASGFWPFHLFSIREKSRLLYLSSRLRDNGLKRPDDFRLAWELSRAPEADGVSTDLKNEFLKSMSNRLRGLSFFDAWPSYAWKPSVYAGLLVAVLSGSVWAFLPVPFPMSSRILFPFGSRTVDQFVSVFPGDARISKGSSIEIKITSTLKSLDKPELYVKSGKEWLPVEASQFIQGVQVVRFERVVEPIQYRVKWKNDWGRKYAIDLVEPVRVESFDVRLREPAYAGGRETRQTSPELSGLPGCGVNLEVTASRPVRDARLFLSDESEIAPASINGRTVRFEFSLSQSGSYGFRLRSTDGIESDETVLYPIYVNEDAPPAVVLLSPEEDLIVGLKERLPVTFSAEDDYGLDEARLVWERSGGERRSRVVKNFPAQTASALETIEWDLEEMGFRGGEIVRFQIQARDRNTVTGPGSASSGWRILEMSSFEKTHEALEEALEVWRDQMVELLADVTTQQAKAEADSSDNEALMRDFNQSAASSRRLEAALKKIVSMMEDDPLADYSLWSEHSAMSDNMAAMNQGTVKRAQAALQVKNKPVAAREMAGMAAEIERMLALSEELSKTQKARDIVDAGDDLEELGRDLAEKLEEAAKKGAPLTQDQKDFINQKINEAMEILQEMAKQIREFPDELPEDFVNQQAVKDLKMDESGDLLSQIQKAIQSGDAAKAMELAKQFLDSVRGMQEQLADAHDSYLEGNSAGKLQAEIAAQQEKLEAVAGRQRDILAETQKLESKRLESAFQKQEERLKELAERQRRAVEKSETLFREGFEPAPARTGLGSQIGPMKSVLGEFESRRVVESRNLLPSVIQGLRVLSDIVVRSSGTAEAARALSHLSGEEQDILDLLNEPIDPANPFGAEDKNQFKNLSQRQRALEKETQGIRQSLQRLSQKTASLGLPMTQSLSDAAGEMGEAGNQLSSQKSGEAQRSEEGALRHLQDAMGSLENAQDMMGQMAGQEGQGQQPGGSQPKVLLRGGASGRRGAKTGRVKLPTAKDYKPPKEFREELLESLREKYPEIYEGIIHKYFKKLSE